MRVSPAGHVKRGVEPPKSFTTSIRHLPPRSLFHHPGWRQPPTMIVKPTPPFRKAGPLIRSPTRAPIRPAMWPVASGDHCECSPVSQHGPIFSMARKPERAPHFAYLGPERCPLATRPGVRMKGARSYAPPQTAQGRHTGFAPPAGRPALAGANIDKTLIPNPFHERHPLSLVLIKNIVV